MANALLMACIGIMVGSIGLDHVTVQPRLTFGRMKLFGGHELVALDEGRSGYRL